MTVEQFHRTNINLEAADAEFLQSRFGHGWTEKVREAVSDYVLTLKTVDALRQWETPITTTDLRDFIYGQPMDPSHD